MRLILAALLLLVISAPARGEDGECRTLPQIAHAVADDGWALTEDLTGSEAVEILAQFPQPLPAITDEVAIFSSPDNSRIVIVGLFAGCARWSVQLRAVGTEI